MQPKQPNYQSLRHSSFIVLIGLVVSSAALAQVKTPASSACTMRQPDKSRPRGLGTVVGIESAARARAEIPLREARQRGTIDPRYLDDQRAVVRQDNGKVDVFDVPLGIAIHVGDRVTIQGSYRSKDYPCSYVPIIITVGGAASS